MSMSKFILNIRGRLIDTIVECKCGYISGSFRGSRGLIDTIVECKFEILEDDSKPTLRLIDTIVECKCGFCECRSCARED